MKVKLLKKTASTVFIFYLSLYLVLMGGGVPEILAQEKMGQPEKQDQKTQISQEKRQMNPLISSFEGKAEAPKIGKSTYALTSSLGSGSAGGTEELLGPLGNAVSIPQVSKFTGSLSTSVPLMLPPGRGGAQPQLVLTYNSGSNSGIAGVGWDINYECITRKTTFGPPLYTQDDTYQYMGEDLILMPDGTYRTKHESFKRFELETDYNGIQYWILTEPNGITKIFGQSDNARLKNPDKNNSQYSVFKWALDRVEDTNGNTVLFGYWNPGKYEGYNYDLLLSDVLYPINFKTTASINIPYYHVDLKYVTPFGKEVTFNYRSGFAVAKDVYRLHEVIIIYMDPAKKTSGSSSTLVRKYNFKYENSKITNRTLLKHIYIEGKKGTKLRFQTFDYDKHSCRKQPKEWFKYQKEWMTGIFKEDDKYPKYFQNYYIGDFNGDGAKDICHALMHAIGGKTDWWVTISTGTGFELQSKYPWLTTTKGVLHWDYLQRFVCVGDFNGDRRDDILIYAVDSNTWKILLSTGKSFILLNDCYKNGPKGDYSTTHNRRDAQVHTGDFNGDGRTDVLYYFRGKDANFPQGVIKGYRYYWTVMLSSGTGFYVPKILIEGKGGSGHYEILGEEDEVLLGDFNGDGKTDILHYVEHKGNKEWRYWRVIGYTGIHKGSGSQSSKIENGKNVWTDTWIIHPTASVKDWASGNNKRKLDVNRHEGDEVFIGDFNGDGMHDLAHYIGENSGNNSKDIYVMLSTDKIFAQPKLWGKININHDKGDRVHTGDINGDGKTDLIHCDKENSGDTWSFITSNGYSFWTPLLSQPSLEEIKKI